MSILSSVPSGLLSTPPVVLNSISASSAHPTPTLSEPQTLMRASWLCLLSPRASFLTRCQNSYHLNSVPGPLCASHHPAPLTRGTPSAPPTPAHPPMPSTSWPEAISAPAPWGLGGTARGGGWRAGGDWSPAFWKRMGRNSAGQETVSLPGRKWRGGGGVRVTLGHPTPPPSGPCFTRVSPFLG